METTCQIHTNIGLEIITVNSLMNTMWINRFKLFDEMIKAKEEQMAEMV